MGWCIAFSFLLLSLGNVNTADASCGDYLADSHMVADHETALQHESGPTTPFKPCHGPGCQKTPEAPAAPSAPATLGSHPDEATTRPATRVSGREFASLFSSRENAALPAGYPESLLRPPISVG
ncbi:MAG: hypothetical protein KDA69_16870 [Planctomycetaceae bacterium]|nr:hypothetical protein [Planctomycetaceae bacterium]MCA9046003.1 hypothetical protein [Planctomycetaceae bacterium]MCB9953999.1 hypothetical protein [Planctomycetaceae bacterium]